MGYVYNWSMRYNTPDGISHIEAIVVSKALITFVQSVGPFILFIVFLVIFISGPC